MRPLQRLSALAAEVEGAISDLELALDQDRHDLAEMLAEVARPDLAAENAPSDDEIKTLRRRIADAEAELPGLRLLDHGLSYACDVAIGRRPLVGVVPLREAAEILDVEPRAAESALRRAEIRSGYPTAQVRWLRDNRPGQGARTDLASQATT